MTLRTFFSSTAGQGLPAGFSKRGVKGGGGVGSYARIKRIKRTLKSRNNASRGIKIPCSRVMEIFEVKGQCLAGPAQNAAVRRVNDELPFN